MDNRALEKAIKDCGLPGRLVEVDKNLVTLDLLNDRTERLERHEYGLSEFCDLLLEWRQKLITRADPGGTSAPRIRRLPADAADAEPDRSVETSPAR
jgi:hypothetical protein